MSPEIECRWKALERRREEFVRKVTELSSGDRITRPFKGGFSPVEVIKHIALAEEFDLRLLVKAPPSTLKSKKVSHGPAFPRMIASLSSPQGNIPTLPSMIPKGVVSLDSASAEWAKVRTLMVPYLAQCESLDSPMLKHMFLVGLLSCSDFFDLLEAHMKYHEERTVLARPTN